jgi:hypothetical protein
MTCEVIDAAPSRPRGGACDDDIDNHDRNQPDPLAGSAAAPRPGASTLRRAVLAIAGANALWVIASLAFAAADASSPATAGTV